MMSGQKELLIIIPAYNEAKNIGAFLDKLEKLELIKEADILVMNDASKDETEQKSKRLKQMSPREKQDLIRSLTHDMKNAAKLLEFEHAAYLRDKIERIKMGKE